MTQRLCIGIQKRNAAWDAILNQLGVWFEEVNYDLELHKEYSVIILNKKPGKAQRSALKFFVKNNGGLLEVGDNLVFLKKSQTHSSREDTLINYDREGFLSHISHADVHTKVELYSDSELLEGLVYLSPEDHSNLASIGVDVAELLQTTGYIRKRFFSRNGEHPDEIVSKVSKHELAEVLKAVLKELHFRRSLPFIEKWTSPTAKPVFCFRIDSDFGDKKSMDNLYETIHKHQKSATWFLHVEAHKDWLTHFNSYQKQEFALHGFEHGTSDSFKKVDQNIQNGEKHLEQANIEFYGFCAPYGIWNTALKKSLKNFDFEYTSEFTFCYDGLPLQLVEDQLPLQIPIHPICTGSLNRRKYSNEDMKGYFEDVLLNKLTRFEPALFYHHPLQPGLSVIDHLLELSDIHEFENLTFGEFAAFWKERERFGFEAYLSDGKVTIERSSDPDKLIQVSMNHLEFDLVSTDKDTINLTKTTKLKYSKPYLPQPEEVSEMRKRDLKLLKTSLLDWKNRGRL
ncbi:hypothetical protein [Gracilimonas sp.]|uniref:hypothetical protein n=1 Tax=Gracilimonas sp. TaxID=1974203 RepID=UPI003BA8A175